MTSSATNPRPDRRGRPSRRTKRLPTDRHLAIAFTVVVACSAVALVAFTTGAGAQPNQIDSCTVIDEPGHYQLTDSVQTDREESCIVVDASDVVVDGDGHAVEGPGAVDDSDDPHFAGVFVDGSSDDPHENVTVRNVAVTGFETGVQVDYPGFGGPDATLENVVIRQNHNGIEHLGGDLTMRNVSVENNDGRALLAGEAGSVAGTDVTVRENGAGISGYESGVSLDSAVIADNDGHGASVGPYVDLTLTDVEVSGNGGLGVAATSAGASLTMDGGSVAENGGPGVTVRGMAEADLTDVHVSGNGEDGIRALGDATVTLSDVAAEENGDLELNGAEGNVSASELRVGPSATTSFQNESVTLEPADREALPTRDGGSAAGDGLNVSGAVVGPLTLELGVDADDDTVDLWRHDGTRWETVGEDLVVTNGTVESSVDRNGTYAPGTAADDRNDTDDGDAPGDDQDDTDGTVTPTPTSSDGDGDRPSPTPIDTDGEKDTPTQTPSDEDDEKEKNDGKTDSPTDSNCGCPSSDGDDGSEDESTPADETTRSPEDHHQQADETDDETASGDGAQTEDADDGSFGAGPGFGPVGALLALLGSALLVRRRR